LAEEKKIALNARLPDRLQVQADRNRIQQALANLLDNAIKYTGPGGNVEVAAYQKGREAILTVKDSGMGISAEDLPRIWDRLYRGDKSRNEKGLGPGTQSGESGCSSASRFGFEVASEVGRGSVFTVSSPWLQRQNPPRKFSRLPEGHHLARLRFLEIKSKITIKIGKKTIPP